LRRSLRIGGRIAADPSGALATVPLPGMAGHRLPSRRSAAPRRLQDARPALAGRCGIAGLNSQRSDGRRRGHVGDAAPGQFRRRGGDPATAYRVGGGEHLLAPGGQLPTALAAPGAAALAALLRGSPDAADQLWLPQAPTAEDEGGPLLIDRFKSPDLLLLSDWLAQLPEATADRAEVSRTLLETFAYQLGRTLALAHAVPLA